ncbi:sugar ABC transporter substrate-binding protein [Paenibacillus popilliae]|uniref:Periplasmic component n=1 Tax=Paenibacillus popilliae ATCC 14706 TaxID=1212764 RepID=M9M532_PAEPP|nr:ABC transporter substrate-binding protein [Paenibacillus popilliae]GAC44224.1 periplasmic component [Paenibacillus popilliae ATCC 14706]
MSKGKYFTHTLRLLTVLAVISALVGCGSRSDSKNVSPSTDSSGQEKLKKITIFQSKVEIAGQLEKLAQKYTEETGNEAEVWGVAGDNYVTQLQVKLTSNQGPSIFSMAPGTEAEKFKSYFYDMSNEGYAKNVAPNMALEVDGKVMGIPYGVEGYGLVYNKDLVDPSEVTDLASFTKTLEKFKDENSNGLALSQEAYFLIGHIINTPIALQPDPVGYINKLNKGEVKMADTKEFQEFAKFLDAIKTYAKNPMEIKYDTQMGGFATMVHQGNWCFSMLKDFGDFGSNIGMMPLPINGNKKLTVAVASYWVVNGTADADEVKAANAFLDWFFNSETGKKTIVEEFQFIPAMTNIEVGKMDPLSQAVYEATQSGETLIAAYNYFPAGIITNDLAPAAQAFFLDKAMSGEQFLEKLDEVWAKAAQ